MENEHEKCPVCRLTRKQMKGHLCYDVKCGFGLQPKPIPSNQKIQPESSTKQSYK